MLNLIYRADVENNANKGTKKCFGLAEASFKVRFANHNKDFKHEQYEKSTVLSKYIWSLKRDQITSRISLLCVNPYHANLLCVDPFLSEGWFVWGLGGLL